MRASGAAAVAVLLLALAAPFVPASAVDSRCATPQSVLRLTMDLPHTTRSVRSGGPVVIVAIGSSSTEGVGASDSAHAYPALLDEELGRRWPRVSVSVINKGVGGEIAAQMLARFDRDVLAYRPQLVIWQTGSNQVLKGESLEAYPGVLREGIGRLKAAGIDVVLMDPQFAPRVLARPAHEAIVDSIAAIADEMKVALFPRFAIMHRWVSSGRYQMAEIVSRDGVHMTDLSYGCIAYALADSVAAAVSRDQRIEARNKTVRAVKHYEAGIGK